MIVVIVLINDFTFLMEFPFLYKNLTYSVLLILLKSFSFKTLLQ